MSGGDLSRLMPGMPGFPWMTPGTPAAPAPEQKPEEEPQKLPEETSESAAEEQPKKNEESGQNPQVNPGGGMPNGFFGFPNMGFTSMVLTPEELQSMLGRRPMPKSVKKPKEEEEEKIDMKMIPYPHEIDAMLSEYVVGQDHAKKAISVAVYNHYKRLANEDQNVDIEKSNMLMIGPTGSGKTFLVRTLANLLDVPLAIADATALTEAGYIGDDIESVVTKLLAAAGNDVRKAERGIIYIDEIDKLARKRNATQRDVSGESVQQGLLKLLEGAEIEVPVGANSKNAMVPLETVNTKNILFICGGAFPDLEQIIKERLNEKSSIGFIADLKDKYDNERDLLKYVETEDLRKFGMIPEFIGRLPVVYTLTPMDKQMLIRVLKEPRNAIIRQYQRLLAMDEVELVFEEDAYELIAEKALKKDTGARALRSIIEEFMLDIMYEIPKDPNIGRVVITREYIEGTGGPRIEMRG
ncbi:MAG: ATP-dependent Clp protease ATP-binding subunit ClpX [Lachnospiraceae bacterium]|nr:ATP-dependent Clp protease ATP-binding subunit ClpX [Lachnospiraceae bacterium]